MFNDHYLWPVTCSECGFVHDAEIGFLRDAEDVRCPRCRSDLTYYSEGLRDQLRLASVVFEHAKGEANRPSWDYLRQKDIAPEVDFGREHLTNVQRTISQPH
jgi:hypothetical protein